MRKLGSDIQQAVNALAGNSKEARINLRAHQVRARYREALESVYRENAGIFLAHTNNVYIMSKDGVPTLIVYVDESIFAAELNAQRELIKLKLLELFGENVDEFEIHISRGNYKQHHPFLTEDAPETDKSPTAVPLDPTESDYVSNTASKIDDPRLRASFEKAMKSDLEWKKGEKANLKG